MTAQLVGLRKKIVWALFVSDEKIFRFETLVELLDYTFSTYGAAQKVSLNYEVKRYEY